MDRPFRPPWQRLALMRNAEDPCLPWCRPFPYQHSKARSRTVSSLRLMGQGTTSGPSLKIRPCLNHTDYGFLQLICKQDRGFRKAPHTSVGSYTEFAWVKRKPSVPSHLAIQRWRLCDRAKLPQQMVYCTRDRGA